MDQETLLQKRFITIAVELIPFYCAYINGEFSGTWRRYWDVNGLYINFNGVSYILTDIRRIAFFAGFIDKVLKNEVLSEGLLDKIVDFCVCFCKQAYIYSYMEKTWDLEIESQVKRVVIKILDDMQAGSIIQMEIQRGRDEAQ
jgi:hypothetical protein